MTKEETMTIHARWSTVTATLLLCATFGAAHLTAQASAYAAKVPVELTYWYAYPGVVQESNEYLTRSFNETVGKEKGIHVTAAYQGGYPELIQKAQAASIAGEAPDVFVMEIGTTGAFAKNGLIEALDGFVARDKFDLSDFQAGILGNCGVGGKLVALPFMPSTSLLFLNSTVLKQAGLDPAGPRTWDELAAYCKTIKEKTGVFGLTLVSNAWFYEAFLLEAGSSVLSADERSTNVNSKAAREAVKYWKDLKDSGYVRILSAAEGPKMSADIMNQKCGMWFYSSAGITTYMGIAKANGFDMNTCFMPKKTSYGTSTGGSNLVISSKATKQKKDAAWEFLKWMTASEQTAYASSKTGYMPSRKSAIESPAMKALYAKVPQFKVAVDQMPYASKRPMNPGYTEGANILTAALDAVWTNNQDIDTAFADAQKRIDKLLTE
jgi:sn-glycerol 3-phosphate transport system substrate-binding protein